MLKVLWNAWFFLGVSFWVGLVVLFGGSSLLSWLSQSMPGWLPTAPLTVWSFWWPGSLWSWGMVLVQPAVQGYDATDQLVPAILLGQLGVMGLLLCGQLVLSQSLRYVDVLVETLRHGPRHGLGALVNLGVFTLVLWISFGVLLSLPRGAESSLLEVFGGVLGLLVGWISAHWASQGSQALVLPRGGHEDGE